MRRRARFTLLMIMAGTLLFGCAKKTIEDSDPHVETSTADIQRPEKTLAGTQIEGKPSLYDASSVYEKEGYQIRDMHAYGDSGIFILYSGISDSVISLYSVTTGTEIKNIKMEDVAFSKDSSLSVSNSQLVYVYDESSNLFCYFDVEQSKYTVITTDFESESIYVENTGKSIYFTKADDCKLYQYIFETGKSQAIYDMTGKAQGIKIINIENNSQKAIVEVQKNGKNQYVRIDIASGTEEVLHDAEGDLYYVGEVYVTVPRTDEVFINVYNSEKPRIVEKFYLDMPEELDNMKLYSGNPYLLTLVEEDEGTTLRFYSLSRGIMNNMVVLPKKFDIIDASYLSMDQTLCIEVADENGEIGLVFWDLEASK